jgi:hypothetical protein
MPRTTRILLGSIVVSFALVAVRAHALAPSFAVGAIYAVGTPGTPMTADLDRDGILDLVLPVAPGYVGVLRGVGDGTFHAPEYWPVGRGPQGVVVVDANRDGAPDLVSADLDDARFSVLINNGDGTFRPAVGYAIGGSNNGPSAIASGDVNHDGIADLVTVGFWTHSISVFLGDGNGVFKHLGTAAFTGANPCAVQVADLDRDGTPDLVTADLGDSRLTIYPNPDDIPVFLPGLLLPTRGQPRGFAIHDLNEDGKLDLVVADSSGQVGSVFLQCPAGFCARADYPLPGPASNVVVEDLSGDARPDLAIACANGVQILSNAGGGVFGDASFIPIGSSPAVVAGDFNQDARVDLAVASGPAGTVTILLNDTPYAIPGSTTRLSVTPDTTSLGEPALLTATVEPSDAAGTIDFTEGGALVGSEPLVDGVAELSVTLLTGGVHSFLARYSGSSRYRPSSSNLALHVVKRLATTCEVQSTMNPAFETDSIRFRAVTGLARSPAHPPAGTVRFLVDGVPLGPADTTAAGAVLSPALASLDRGLHRVAAVFEPFQSEFYDSSESPPLVQEVLPADPVIVGVSDVPNDQGGRVRLAWRCEADRPGSRAVRAYRLWRCASSPPAGLRVAVSRNRPASAPKPAGAMSPWIAVLDQPAEQLVEYHLDLETSQDSTAAGNPLTWFLVQALTSDASITFSSLPDSGYSVDNIPPPAPFPFTANESSLGISLAWGTSPAADFQEFRLYRGQAPDFVPDPGALVHAGRDTVFTDPVHGEAYYKLAAVDRHDNVSPYSVASPQSPTAAAAGLVSAQAAPGRVLLVWYGADLPGLPATVYRQFAGSDWEALASIDADGQGFARFDDHTVVPGGHYGYRLGYLVHGTSFLSLPEAVVVPTGHLSLLGFAPNPVRGGTLMLNVDADASQPMRARVLDLAGRIVLETVVPGPRAGLFSLVLDQASSMHPGMYVLELRQGAERVRKRFTYLR